MTTASAVRRRGKGTTALLVGPAAAFFLLLLVMPLAVVLIYSFGERAPAGGYAPAFTFDNYLNLASRGQAFLHLEDLVARGVVVTDGSPSIASEYRMA